MAQFLNEVRMSEVMSTVTLRIKVKGLMLHHVRTWLGLRIMELGAWVTGCKMEIEFEA